MSIQPAEDGIPRSRSTLLLAAVLLLALGLRLWGIGWGLPDALHNRSFHPDETILLEVSLPELGGMNLAAGRFLPHYYHYGSLPFTLTSAAVLLGQSYHLIGGIVTRGGAVDTAQLARAYVAARLLSALLGVGTVWAVYALGRRCFRSSAVGLLGAFLLAVCPLHAQHSHYATVDVGAAFWLTAALVQAAKLMDAADARARVRAALAAGLLAGLSAATKYSGVIVVLSVVAALVVLARRRQLAPRQAAMLALAAAGACAAAFLIACPGCVLDTAIFLRDTRMESSHVMHQPELYFQQTGVGWVYLGTRNLDAACGLPLLLLGLAGLVYGCVRRERGDWLLLAFFAPTYLLLGAAQSRYARYDIPLLPLIALWAARLCVAAVAAGLRQTSTVPRRLPIAALTAVLATGVALFTLAECVILLAPMSQRDPRERAALWLQAHAPAPAVIGLSGSPWFWTPPLDPDFSLPEPDAWKVSATPAELARYCYNSNLWLDPQILKSCRAPFVVLTEYQYYDPLRLHWASAAAYLAELRSEYGAPAMVFRSVHPLGGARELDGLPVQDLPHDMLYPDPTIVVYARTPAQGIR